jgi:hypothetical protein
MNATLKMGVHLEVIRLNLLHFPPLKVCLTFEHTFLASCAFTIDI